MKIDFKEVLKKYRDWLWPTIQESINKVNDYPEFCQVSKKYQKELDFHKEIVGDYPQRQGKYLRPTLLLLTAQAMGVSKNRARRVAAAMQMSEDWILNHDDIEDDSPDRRGKPALHKIVGTELAINAGDGLHVLMWEMLLDSPKEIQKEFLVMLKRTVLGQTIELKWAKDNRKVEQDDVMLILESKTGYYTIAGPMRLGAILAGANKNQLKTIYKFGVVLGKAFQIVDDVLDLTSDFAGLKKVKGRDIVEGKRTVMMVDLIKKSNQKDKQIISKIMNKKRVDKTEKDVETIISLMEKYGSIEYSKKLAAKFAKEAIEIFDKEMQFIKREPFRSEIRAGIDFIVNRDH